MPLAGNTRELSLADLILVKTQDPRNYRFALNGPAGDGLLFIEGDRIVHAAYGELPPADAAYLLVTERNVDFELEADVEIAGRTLELGAQELLMEAMRRMDEGTLRRPRPVSLATSSTGTRREPPRPRSYEAKRSPEAEALRRAMGRVLFADTDANPGVPETSGVSRLIPVGVGALLLAALGLAWRFDLLATTEHRSPVEISDLEGPRDVAPVLVSGGPPRTPAPVDGFLPTVLLRLLIDARGRVHEAFVFQPRAGLEAFEEAAVVAAKSYRFRPAEREGVPVPAWIHWPVDFVPGAEGDTAPIPIEARYFKVPRDRLPALLEGENPPTPIPERRLRPKITCRVLVDEQGRVVDAEVLEPRADLELYERVALDTVRTFRFSPGEREGVKVPAWVNWTIEFQ